jgi:L-threonylcarbamoyladenylate synthase
VPQTLNPSATAVLEAAAILRRGGLVAFPTETVYGLGADATNAAAVSAIFRAKGRPADNPLICHVADLASARRLGVFDQRAERLIDAFWPGALTLIVKRRPDCRAVMGVSAGLDTIAIRLPDHELALSLLRETGRPLAAPSANRSGAVSPTTAAHVVESLGPNVELVLNGGACRVGLESTVLAIDGAAPVLLRPGSVTIEMLRHVVGPIDQANAADADQPKSPGMLESHYAPDLAVRLDIRSVDPGEALLAFGPDAPPHDGASLNLSENGDLEEAAANLFGFLRALDQDIYTGIAVMPLPDHGMGRAINDRLRRAAAARPTPSASPA